MSARGFVGVRLPGVAQEERGGLLGCLAVVVAQHVGIGLQKEPDICVTGSAADPLMKQYAELAVDVSLPDVE